MKNIKLVKMLIKMLFYTILSVLDILEECKKGRL